MASTHSLTGALSGAVLTPALAPVLGFELTPATYVAGIAVCAGGALLPDIDHPSAKISRMFGPITMGFARIVQKVSGGHRALTHTIFFCLLTVVFVAFAQPIAAATLAPLFDFLTGVVPADYERPKQALEWIAAGFTEGTLTVFLIVWYFTGLGLIGLRGNSDDYFRVPIVNNIGRGPVPLLLSAGVAWVLTYGPLGKGDGSLLDVGLSNPLPWMIAIGALTHIAGDALTTEGVRPFTVPPGLLRQWVGFPILGKTTSVREKILCMACAIALFPVAGFVYYSQFVA